MPHEVGGTDPLRGRGVYLLLDLVQRFCCCGVCRIDYIQGDAAGITVSEGINLGLREVCTEFAYRRNETWRFGWCGQGGNHGEILKASHSLISAWLCQLIVAYEIFNNHGVPGPLTH